MNKMQMYIWILNTHFALQEKRRCNPILYHVS